LVPGRLAVGVEVGVDVEADEEAVDDDADADEAVTPGRTRRVKLGMSADEKKEECVLTSLGGGSNF
jgi:hypothetical protein